MTQEIVNLKTTNTKLDKELDSYKCIHKEKRAEWKLKEQEYVNSIHKSDAREKVLEEKVKELETFLMTNKNIQDDSQGPRGNLILLKDESQKNTKSNKLKYLLKAIPSGSTKTSSNEIHDTLISFSDMSTKIPEKSKPGSMKKNNPYKIEYFKNNKDS